MIQYDTFFQIYYCTASSLSLILPVSSYTYCNFSLTFTTDLLCKRKTALIIDTPEDNTDQLI